MSLCRRARLAVQQSGAWPTPQRSGMQLMTDVRISGRGVIDPWRIVPTISQLIAPRWSASASCQSKRAGSSPTRARDFLSPLYCFFFGGAGLSSPSKLTVESVVEIVDSAPNLR